MTDGTEDLSPFKRNRYFTGKLMTVSDFTNEQEYFNEKLALIKRAVLGSGCVYGLDVQQVVFSVNKWSATMTSGVAFTKDGKEIVVNASNEIDVDTKALQKYDNNPVKFLNALDKGDNLLGLFLKPNDEKDPQLVPVLSTSSTCKENCESLYTLENFNAYFDIIDRRKNVEDTSHLKIDTSTTNIRKLANDFYNTNLTKRCFDCDQTNDGILVAILIQKDTDNPNILVPDPDATKKLRKVVYNNSLIYRLLAQHIIESKEGRGVDSVNGLQGTIKLDSSTLDFKTQGDDPNIPLNVLQVEPKLSTLQIITGTVELTFTDDLVQDFGPVSFNFGDLQNPPGVILTQTNPTFDIADYDQYYLDGVSPVDFAPINVHADYFDIRLWRRTKVQLKPTPDSNKLYLRYYLLVPAKKELPKQILTNIPETRIVTSPPNLVKFDDGIIVYITDAKQQKKSNITFKVSSVYLQSKINPTASSLTGGNFQKTIKASSVSQDNPAPDIPSTIKSIQGDMLKILYNSQNGTLERNIKVRPSITIDNKQIRDPNASINGKIIDISATDAESTELKAFVEFVGRQIPLNLSPSIPKSASFTFKKPLKELNLEQLVNIPFFKGIIPIRIRYDYQYQVDPSQKLNSSEMELTSVMIPIFTINNSPPGQGAFHSPNDMLKIVVIDALPAVKDVKLNVVAKFKYPQILGIALTQLSDTFEGEIDLRGKDQFNKVERLLTINNLIKKIPEISKFVTPITSVDRIIDYSLTQLEISYKFKDGTISRELTHILNKI